MNSVAQGLRRLPPAIWLLLLLPLLAVLSPIPIDETRYLSIAWEMRQTGQWVTLHLNGLPYFDKPPLLFWLLNAVWAVLGPSLWTARALLVACGVGCVALCGRVERKLVPEAGNQASWMMLGLIFFVLYTGVVMFDVLLCLCVLSAFLAIVAYVQERGYKALLWLFVASALGVLAKGPVMLLHLAGPIVLARWWSMRSSPRVTWRTVLVMVLVAVLGGMPALAWAWAAVHHLNPADAQELLLHQTAGRVVQSFAHNRPIWWYLPWVPVLLLPWPLLLRWRRMGHAMNAWRSSRAARFGICATVPALLAFCIVSGKQMHYLLPVMPGAAILLSAWFRQDAGLIAVRRVWVLLVVMVGVLGWAVLSPSPLGNGTLDHATATGLYVLAAVLLVIAMLAYWLGRGADPAARVALVALWAGLAMLPLVRLQAVSALDVRGVAQRASELRASGVPLARTGNEPGLLTFLARMPSPLPEARDPEAWCRQHPDGVLLAYQTHGKVPAEAIAGTRLANGWVALLPSAFVVARPKSIDKSGDAASD
ncbi:ArnT family glycosyltransferase [Dyella telluris]|uniref:Glycosyltransferase family 39 protein n=1 Tax=Dyella telluris TaxID=2763498 RepID=A0A7G8PZ38_9GAMM|nr:glycosyltransferase family 39 protein [Dyella telluris]QNJ99795.1 glycosyltransferase family 39 protein [Dyella telluris]